MTVDIEGGNQTTILSRISVMKISMPTFRERQSAASMTHSNQTWYYILAHPPDVGNVTYQITPRAADFLTGILGYSNEQPIPWSLVSPLRQIKDLFTKDEGTPSDANPKGGEVRSFQTTSIDAATKTALITYLESHPDVEGDLTAAAADLNNNDPTFVDHLERQTVTKQWEQHQGNPVDDSLGAIAQKYFGDSPPLHEVHDTDAATRGNGSLEGEDGSDSGTIVVSDREGTTYEFPNLDERNGFAEAYRVDEQIYRRWGPIIGESIVNSARYEPEDAGFPNRWIGQTEKDPEPSIEDAISPMAYYYRQRGAHGEGEPAQVCKELFEEECEFDLETYRANFPTAVNAGSFETTYTTVKEATKPWEDFQLPPSWIERFDGSPPLIRGLKNDCLQETDEALLEALQSLENYPQAAPSLLTKLNHEGMGKGIRRFLSADFDLYTLSIRGDAALQATVNQDGHWMDIAWLYDGDATIELQSDRLAGTHEITLEEWCVTEWEPPATEEIHDTQTGLLEQSLYFGVVRDVVDAIA